MDSRSRKGKNVNMHIKDKLAEAQRTKKPVFSFEFFPPKTAQVLQYLGQALH